MGFSTRPLDSGVFGWWSAELQRLPDENAARPLRERLTLMRIFEALRDAGYSGSYDAVRRYSRAHRRAQGSSEAPGFVPLSFAPGEAYQFDWSQEIVVLDGVTVTVKVAQVRLCHSRMPFVRAYPRETVADERSTALGSVISDRLTDPIWTNRIGTPPAPASAAAVRRRSALSPHR